MHRLCLLICGADIPMGCKLGRGVEFGHFGLGVVISEQTRIGDNSIIYHGVTIGRSRGFTDNAYSLFKGIEIGENTLIGARATLLTKTFLRIGSNCEIGAGAVVLEDVPDNCIAVGNPARIIRKELMQPEDCGAAAVFQESVHRQSSFSAAD